MKHPIGLLGHCRTTINIAFERICEREGMEGRGADWRLTIQAWQLKGIKHHTTIHTFIVVFLDIFNYFIT